MTKAEHKMSPFSVFLLGVDSMIGSAAFLLPGSLYAKAGIMIIPILIPLIVLIKGIYTSS